MIRLLRTLWRYPLLGSGFRRRTTTLVLSTTTALALFTSCSAGTAPNTSSSQSAPAASTSSPGSPGLSPTPQSPSTRAGSAPASTADVEPSPVACAVTSEEIAEFRRNWDRVAGSVGRSDHTTYTGPFLIEMRKLAAKAVACPGAEHLPTLTAAAEKIDAAARKEAPDFASITIFVDAGNSWLEALGYGSGLLTSS